MSKAIAVTLVLLTIQRSEYHTITDSVFKHEVPILELIHGEDNVTVVNDDYHEIELPDSATVEYQRLLTKYGEKYKPAVEQAFPRGARDVARELDMQLGKDDFKKQSEALIVSRLPPRPSEKAEDDSTAVDLQTTGPANPPAIPDGGASAGAANPEPGEPLTYAQIKEELTARGIEHKGNAPREELQALLDEAKAGDKADGGTLGD